MICDFSQFIFFTHKVGDRFVYDCNAEEASCASAAVIVAIDCNNNCCGVHKIYGGCLTLEEILYAYDVRLQ